MKSITKKRFHNLPILVIGCWLFLSVSRGVIFWIPASAYIKGVDDYIAGDPLMGGTLLVLLFISIILLAGRYREVRHILKKNLLVLLIFIIIFMSTFWAINPMISLKRYIRCLGTLIMVILLLTGEDNKNAIINVLKLLFLSTIILSFLLIQIYPVIGKNNIGEWVGLTNHKNTLGQLTSIGSLFFLWYFNYESDRKWKVISLIVFLISLYMLFNSSSMTAVTQTSMGVAIYMVCSLNRFLTKNRILFWLHLGFISIGALIIVEMFFLNQSYYQMILSVTNRDFSLTGRIPLWENIFNTQSIRPWLGFGYSGFWGSAHMESLWSILSWEPFQAHNGYIDVIIEIGIAGFVLFGLLIVRTIVTSIKNIHYNYKFGVLILIILFSVLYNNLFESSFIRQNHLYWFLFLLAALVFSIDKKEWADGSNKKIADER